MTPTTDDGEHPPSDDAKSHTSTGKRSRDQTEKPQKIPASIKSCNECRQQKVSLHEIDRTTHADMFP